MSDQDTRNIVREVLAESLDRIVEQRDRDEISHQARELEDCLKDERCILRATDAEKAQKLDELTKEATK